MKVIRTGQELQTLQKNTAVGREAMGLLAERFREAVAACRPGSSWLDTNLASDCILVLLEPGDDPADLSTVGLGTNESSLRTWVPEAVCLRTLDGMACWEIAILFNNQLMVTVVAPVDLFTGPTARSTGDWEFLRFADEVMVNDEDDRARRTG